MLNKKIETKISRADIILVLAVFAWTLFNGINEVTWDRWDDWASNYWLGFGAVAASVLMLMLLVMVSDMADHIRKLEKQVTEHGLAV
jgi:uncharacterized membrane protein YcjF (UPF0283 family)